MRPDSTEPSHSENTNQQADAPTPKVKILQKNLKLKPWQLLCFVAVFGLLGIYTMIASFASPRTAPVPTSPLSYTQSWQARYADDRGLNSGCFGVDDTANWQGKGTLAPGASYTFTPSYPTCSISEIPMIAMHVSWSGSTQVKLETTNPFASASVANNMYGPYYNNIHEVAPVTADASGNQQANLCMWLDGTETVYAQKLVAPPTQLTQNYHLPWTMTITNTGSQTANITASSGYEANGWQMNLYPACRRADGDNDHWNDSLEMVMEDNTYLAGGLNNPQNNFQGSNYVAASGTSTANDEIDFSPADFNDDGVINQADIDTVSSHLGEGDDVSIDQIGPNQGTPGYFADEVKTWRRYDIDGDGRVTQHDIAWVKTLVGQPLPLVSDPLDPWAVLHVPATVPANYGGYRVNAYAVDNDMISHVDMYATISGKQQLLCQTWGYDQPIGVPDTSSDLIGCSWNTPRQSGTSVLLSAKVYDNAGHSYTTSKTVTVQ